MLGCDDLATDFQYGFTFCHHHFEVVARLPEDLLSHLKCVLSGIVEIGIDGLRI